MHRNWLWSSLQWSAPYGYQLWAWRTYIVHWLQFLSSHHTALTQPAVLSPCNGIISSFYFLSVFYENSNIASKSDNRPRAIVSITLKSHNQCILLKAKTFPTVLTPMCENSKHNCSLNSNIGNRQRILLVFFTHTLESCRCYIGHCTGIRKNDT